MHVEIAFFGLWFLTVVGVVVFRYLTAKSLYSCMGRSKKRMDGSYWGVYSSTKDPEDG
jgi:hypothetical protein